MASESLVWDILVRDQASRGLAEIGRAAGGAAKDTDVLTRRLEDLSRKSVEARVRLAGDREAQAALDKMDARLLTLDRRVASPNLRVEGAARAIAEITAVDAELDRLGGKGGTAESATASLGLGGLSGPTGMGALIGAGVALSPVLATVGLGLGGLGLAAYGASKNTALMHQELAPLRSEVSQFQQALQPQVLKLFGDGIGIATTLLGDLEPVARATGDALHGVLGEVGAELKSGEFRSFFSWMGQTAGPDVKLLGGLIVDLLKDVPPLAKDLQPLAVGLLHVADAGLKAVGGLERMHLELPLIGAVIGNMVAPGGIGALVGGLAGLGVELIGLGPKADQNLKAIAALPDKVHLAAAATIDWSAVVKGAREQLRETATNTGVLGDLAATAAPKVGTLAGDMAILNAAVMSGNSQLAAYDDLWLKFVGASVSDQQAVLNVTAAFDGYNSAVTQSGVTSTAARQGFLSIFTAIGTGLDTLHKNGASVRQLNDFYQANIGKLKALHGLTPQQRQDIQGLIRDYDAWATSTEGLDKKTRSAAATIANDYITELQAIHHWSPQVSADAGAFADAILKTGDRSSATQGARAQLIRDLEKAGLSAKGATALVDSLQLSIDKVHGKTVGVNVAASGSGGIKLTGPGTSGREWDLRHLAAGGMITGGIPGRDSVLGLLKPGELVVTTDLVASGAVDHLRGKLPGFASGGLVQEAPWAADSLAALAGPALGSGVAAVLGALVKAAASALGGAGSGALGGDPAANKALARAMFPWPPVQWPFFDYVEMREAGYNRFARNPASGAYGLPQALPESKLPFAGQSAGGSHAGAQLSWMFDYIRQVYRTPAGAAFHEAAFNWYDAGGVLGPGLTLALNTTGRPERVIPPGGGAAPVYNISYNISVQASPLARPADIGREAVAAIKAFEKGSGAGWRQGRVNVAGTAYSVQGVV